MTEAELLELLLNLTEGFNTVLEFWISITFAFVLAIHFSSGRMSLRLHKYLFILYTTASIIFTGRAIGLAANGLGVVNRISDAGYEGLSGIPNQPLLIVVATILLMVIGTIATLIFTRTLNRDLNGT